MVTAWQQAKIRESGTAVIAFDAEDAAMQVKALLRRGARTVEITNDGNDGATDAEGYGNARRPQRRGRSYLTTCSFCTRRTPRMLRARCAASDRLS